MNWIEKNLQFLCKIKGIDFDGFLNDFNIDDVDELVFAELEEIAENFEVPLQQLIFKNLTAAHANANGADIKLLVLDVDGVMTDGGMYFTENGDQFKKFNTKDGMGIMNLQKKGIEVCIISNGFKGESIKARAQILGITKCYVGRDPKLGILETWVKEMKIDLLNVAMIGDDINDLSIMEKVGLSAAPIDAVPQVLERATITLAKKGGEGCVREFIDNFLVD
jgi:3-deoxy-D-manno-octulosonate 8-phosphate phosphatase (KDO 8-P phosphatase)